MTTLPDPSARAAAGFCATPERSTDPDFEFLFTRAIEFRQETIYFLIVDRFHDGDPENSSGFNPELYDASRQKWGKYWGGDLQGIIDKLDYLRGMGVTAIWVSPLFEQVETMQFEYTAMHGYWTKDFKRINPRFLPLNQDNSLHTCTLLDKFISEIHQRGMKLILDIVCNHSSPDINGHKGELYDDGKLIADFYRDVNGWYHHNGQITDWEDPWQLENCEMVGLADFNEQNVDFRNYIKSAIKLWLDRGVDALRVDTVKHMALWFWQEFCADLQTHKPSTFVFGEWGFSKPYDRRSVHFANRSGMSILDFGFCEGIRAAIAKNQQGGFHLVQNIIDLDHLYDTATELVTFIDNHDMPRFQSLNPDPKLLEMAVALVMTSRGIPCIYYGTEQYLHNDTNGGNDPYNRPMMECWDPESLLYKNIRQLSKLRRINPAISLGSQIQKYITPDIYCYLRRYRDSRCLVAMNKGSRATITIQNTELEDGLYICMFTQRQFEVRSGHLVDIELGAKEVIALSYIGDRVDGKTIVRVQLNGILTQYGETVVVTGDCLELGAWDIKRAYQLEYINRNTWFGEIPFVETAGKPIAYKYAVVRADGSAFWEDLVCRRWILASEGIVKWRDSWSS